METKAKNVVQLKDVKKNVLVHKVYALGPNSFIEDIILLSEPSAYSEIAEPRFKHINTDPEKTWVKIFRKNGCYDDTNSLCDMGIIDNNYNSHKTFKTVEDARIYRQECIDGFHPSPVIKHEPLLRRIKGN